MKISWFGVRWVQIFNTSRNHSSSFVIYNDLHYKVSSKKTFYQTKVQPLAISNNQLKTIFRSMRMIWRQTFIEKCVCHYYVPSLQLFRWIILYYALKISFNLTIFTVKICTTGCTMDYLLCTVRLWNIAFCSNLYRAIK